MALWVIFESLSFKIDTEIYVDEIIWCSIEIYVIENRQKYL